MKKLIPILLALALSLACLTASAEETRSKDGLAVDAAATISGKIPGAAVAQYEPAIDRLNSGATANDVGTYRVIVCDTQGNPLEGVVVQFCDDFTCAFEVTGADGVAVFNDREQKVWTVHLPVAPDGYAPDEGEYNTLDTFSDVNIFLEKAA